MRRRALRSRAGSVILDDREGEEEFLDSLGTNHQFGGQCIGESLASYLNDSLAKRAEVNSDRADHRLVPRHHAITESVIRL